MKTINIAPRHLDIIQSILSQYPYDFYAFGSRAKNKNKVFSDLDLCYKQAIPAKTLGLIITAFSESDLPFHVDLICWDDLSEEFRVLIKPDLVLVSHQ